MSGILRVEQVKDRKLSASFHLTPLQTEIFLAGPNGKNRRRFRVVVAGRRSGKTYLALTELATFAANHPYSRCYYFAPTHRQAKEIAWGMLKAMLIPMGVLQRPPNESELTCTFKNGATVMLRGTENFDALRGIEIDFCVLDEYALMDDRVWEEIIRPTLATTRGSAMWISTPRGRDKLYELWKRGQDPLEDDWYSWQFTSAQGGLIPPDEIEQARHEMDEKRFKREFEAGWDDLAIRIYHAFNRDVNIKNVEDSGGEILVGMDFNIDPMSACLASRAGDQLHIWGEIVLDNSNTEEMALELKSRYPERRLHVFPDPSGRKRITTANAGVTDFNILRNFGFIIDAPYTSYLIVDRINTVNAALKDAAGITRVYISPDCPHVIRSLDTHTYKEGTKIPEKRSGLDHMADASGYLICGNYGLLLKGRSSVERLVI